MAQIAEFYILPEKRRQGIGKRAVIEIFDLYPGNWELQVHARNKAAILFWEKVIPLKTKDKPFVSEIASPDGKRIQFRFAV
jgi:predicted acetyltransferase